MEQIRELISPEFLYPIAMIAFRLLLILLAAFVGARMVGRLIMGLRVQLVELMKRRAGGTATELEKRAATLSGIVRKTVAVVIWGVALVMMLKTMGFDIGPILAGAGVVGLAVGFGAQNLVRDVISGLFILMENQIRVNDVAVINGTGGLVVDVNLRTTILRGLDGVVHVFPNGSINTLSNMTYEYSYFVFETGVAYKEDTDRVTAVLKEVADGLMREEPYSSAILEPLEVLGVDQFADSAVIIKSRIKTKPIQQWMIGREMNRRIKKKFDEVGIEIPFPHVSVYFGEASRPVRLDRGSPDREELKQVVREVLQGLRAEGQA